MGRTSIQSLGIFSNTPRQQADLSPALECVSIGGHTIDDAGRRRLAMIIEQTLLATQANGIALALEAGGQVLCCARAGELAPGLGAELDRESGISGLCLRTGEGVRCVDVAADARVDIEAARSLGIASIIAVPLIVDGVAIGLLEVFSQWRSEFGLPEEAAVRKAAIQIVSVLKGAAKLDENTPPQIKDQEGEELDTLAPMRKKPALSEPARERAWWRWRRR
jgi:GAF domain